MNSSSAITVYMISDTIVEKKNSHAVESGVFPPQRISFSSQRVSCSSQRVSCSSQRVSYPSQSAISSRGGRLLPSRYILVLLGFSACVVMTSQRLNLSMALVAMVNETAVYQSVGENDSKSDCPARIVEISNTSETNEQKKGGHFLWNSQTQNQIVSASFLGFVLTQTPGGRMSETLGSKHVLAYSLIVASVCNLLSPVASEMGPFVLMGMQFVKGLAQGATQPAIGCLMARWFPKPEKGFLSSVTFSGYPFGGVVGGFLCGIMCDSGVMGGWPLVFYVFGITGILLALLVLRFCFNAPDDDFEISEKEYKYIISNMDSLDTEVKYKTPWKSIGTNVGTWALLAGMFGQYWMTFYFLTVHPTYLGAALHFSNTESGVLNSLPYIGQIIITWSSSYLSDLVVNKGFTSIDTVRKICNSLSCIGFSLSLIGVTYAGCDKKLNTIFFVAAISCVGFGYPGANIVALDMTIAFAGTLMGITSTVASASGFIIPLIVGALTRSEQTLTQWRKVLFISSGVGLVTGIIFAVFGSAKLQGWDSSDSAGKIESSVNNEVLDEKLAGIINDAFDDVDEEPGSPKVRESAGFVNEAFDNNEDSQTLKVKQTPMGLESPCVRIQRL